MWRFSAPKIQQIEQKGNDYETHQSMEPASSISLKVDDELARKQLGHSSSKTTQIYIRKDKPMKPIK